MIILSASFVAILIAVIFIQRHLYTKLVAHLDAALYYMTLEHCWTLEQFGVSRETFTGNYEIQMAYAARKELAWRFPSIYYTTMNK